MAHLQYLEINLRQMSSTRFKDMGKSYSCCDTKIIVAELQDSDISLGIILNAAHYLVNAWVLKIVVVKITNHNHFLLIRQQKLEELCPFRVYLAIFEYQPLYISLEILDACNYS
jgi:hypothetical protein